MRELSVMEIELVTGGDNNQPTQSETPPPQTQSPGPTPGPVPQPIQDPQSPAGKAVYDYVQALNAAAAVGAWLGGVIYDLTHPDPMAPSGSTSGGSSSSASGSSSSAHYGS